MLAIDDGSPIHQKKRTNSYTSWSLFLLPPFSAGGESVADPGCLSRIPDPESRIPDPTTAPKERGKNIFPTNFGSHKNLKIVNNLIFEQVKKFFWPKH